MWHLWFIAYYNWTTLLLFIIPILLILFPKPTTLGLFLPFDDGAFQLGRRRSTRASIQDCSCIQSRKKTTTTNYLLCRSSSLLQTASNTEDHGGRLETLTERRIRQFWEQESQQHEQASERIVQFVLENGAASGTNGWRRRTLLEPIVGKNTNNDKDTVMMGINPTFVRFYNGDWLPPSGNLSSCAKPTKRKTYRLILAYNGRYFAGWQKQMDQQWSVQDAVEGSLAAAFGKAIDVRVSGRTDSGVHAIGQVARVRIPHTSSEEVFRVLETASAVRARHNHSSQSVSWRCLSVTPTHDRFHPIFGATSRSYVYVLDGHVVLAFYRMLVSTSNSASKCLLKNDEILIRVSQKMDTLLQELEGQELDYFSFSYGKIKTETTLCCLSHSRARLLRDHMPPQPNNDDVVLAIELTGNRFLRRMVRKLVATALELACSTSCPSIDDDNPPTSLVGLCTKRDRSQTATAAPPGGLIFVCATVDN